MSKKNKFKNKQMIKKVAEERMKQLFDLAKNVYSEDMELANRYIYLARMTSMKYKVPIEREDKRLFCKHCKTMLIPSKNARVRITGKTITYYCEACRKFTRIGYKKKKD